MRYEEIEKMYLLEDSYWWFVGRRRLVADLVKRYAPARATILDIGCGTGGTMDYLAPLGEVTGADMSGDALQFCRDRGHRAILRCCAQTVAIKDASFDVVIACDLLEHLEDDTSGLAEMFRVVKPGGVLILTVPAHAWLWSEHDEALSHLRRYSKREIQQAVGAAGGQVLKLTYAVSLVFPVVLVVRLLRKLLRRRPGKPHTQLMSLPGWANRVLVFLHDLEAWWITRAPLPWGATVVGVFQRPDDG